MGTTIDEREGLTARQRAVLELLIAGAKRGCQPSYREIGAAMGINGTNGVAVHINALCRKGYVARNYGMNRALTIIDAPEPPPGMPIYDLNTIPWKR